MNSQITLKDVEYMNSQIITLNDIKYLMVYFGFLQDSFVIDEKNEIFCIRIFFIKQRLRFLWYKNKIKKILSEKTPVCLKFTLYFSI